VPTLDNFRTFFVNTAECGGCHDPHDSKINERTGNKETGMVSPQAMPVLSSGGQAEAERQTNVLSKSCRA
jgi:hypothetical protein